MMRALMVALLLLSGCGALPQPFFGNPGAQGMRLSAPPAGRLAVPVPDQSLLPDSAAQAWARDVATSLQEQEIPANFGATRRGDWTLGMQAELRGETVVASYTVKNPAGVAQGSTEAPPVPARDWASGDPAVLKSAADRATPGISALLQRIEAARRQSDPTSLVNRPARIWLSGVSGAPGDGDRSLTEQMRLKLAALGLVVQDTAKNADFKLEGDVKTAPGANGTTRVEVQWIVTDATQERGRIVQLNEVPPRNIAGYWGDIAVAVAEQAAGGVREVVTNTLK